MENKVHFELTLKFYLFFYFFFFLFSFTFKLILVWSDAIILYAEWNCVFYAFSKYTISRFHALFFSFSLSTNSCSIQTATKPLIYRLQSDNSFFVFVFWAYACVYCCVSLSSCVSVDVCEFALNWKYSTNQISNKKKNAID